MRLDKQCFKLIDPRIQAVQRGKLSLQMLVHSIRPYDWLIQYKDTIYALTEDQYYAAQQLKHQYFLTKQKFEQIFKILETLDISQQDMTQLLKIKQLKKSCSTCKYNSYKTKVMSILRKYPSIIERLMRIDSIAVKNSIREYPKIKTPIISKITKVVPSFFTVEDYSMTPCLDCVEKHVSMAYRKGCQAQKGYPQHLVFAIADLQNAYQQCPNDMDFLKQHLMFCIGKTIKDGKAFIPIDNILYLINLARRTTKTTEANIKNQQDEAYSLEFTIEIQKVLQNLDVITKMKILKEVQTLISIIYSDSDNIQQEFQGQMGILQDTILPYSIQASNILRNRRLIFKYSPKMMRNTEYDCKDLLSIIQNPENQEKV